eukprot:CAMPEP_0185191046 /NCGR_PEP_ID=MMETSP1140-20130426/13358_1 /TAXON_ID=298111 /ORGANISM="Pavlova sp., Strain CCMP459" /LENGTH=224 /DNA_ID=CAMNT_0027757727 /DNA_START=183 /DNA_END=853 /DNA_ORIENTATION=-
MPRQPDAGLPRPESSVCGRAAWQHATTTPSSLHEPPRPHELSELCALTNAGPFAYGCTHAGFAAGCAPGGAMHHAVRVPRGRLSTAACPSARAVRGRGERVATAATNVDVQQAWLSAPHVRQRYALKLTGEMRAAEGAAGLAPGEGKLFIGRAFVDTVPIVEVLARAVALGVALDARCALLVDLPRRGATRVAILLDLGGRVLHLLGEVHNVGAVIPGAHADIL